MLIKKVQVSDFVDVTNMTLEQDMLRELVGLKCSYVAVVTDDNKKELWYLRQGMDKWFRDNNHILRDVNQVTKIVGINIKHLADPEFSKV